LARLNRVMTLPPPIRFDADYVSHYREPPLREYGQQLRRWLPRDKAEPQG